MIKVICCLVLISGCYILGCIKAGGYKQRCRELEEIIEIIKLMELDITYRRDPLAISFNKISKLKYCWFSSVLKQCSIKLQNQVPLNDAWYGSISEIRSKSQLNDADINIINDMMLSLGRTDSDGQRKVFAPTVERLSSNLYSAKQRSDHEGKMFKALGAAAGIMLSIILI